MTPGTVNPSPSMIPPLQFSSTAASGASSGDAAFGLDTNAGTMNVNYGNGVSQGGAIPPMVWYVALAIAGFWAWKKYS